MAEIFNFYVQDNRTIQFPKSNLLEPIMQEDHKVATWRFRIPKVLNQINMSAWSWWFVYVNAKGQEFSKLLTLTDDIDEPASYSTADYDIDYGISKFPGSFSFALEAISAQQGGEISGEWHTKTYKHKVDGTLQGNQAEYAETESDVISALMQEVRNKANQLVGGATPLPVSLKSQMTDHDKVYLYTGAETGESTGYWYYWNGVRFVPGGVYGAGDPESVQGYVEDWLDNHPEATTTVQDGSITETKLADALKLKIIKDYVTPEIFGAVGDGVTDDSAAIQSASQAGVIFGGGKTYYIGAEITLTNDIYGCNFIVNKEIGVSAQKDNLIICDCDFQNDDYSPSTDRGEFMLYIANSNNVTIIECRFHKGVSALYIDRCSNIKIQNCLFDDLEQLNTTSGNGYGILFIESKNAVVANNIFHNVARHGVYISADATSTYSENILIEGNIFEWDEDVVGNTTGYEQAIIMRPSKFVTISNNQFVNVFGVCSITVQEIYVDGVLTAVSSENVTIKGNTGYFANHPRYSSVGVIFVPANETYSTSVAVKNLIVMDNDFTITKGGLLCCNAFDSVIVKNNHVVFESTSGYSSLFVAIGAVANGLMKSIVIDGNNVIGSDQLFSIFTNPNRVDSLTISNNNVELLDMGSLPNGTTFGQLEILNNNIISDSNRAYFSYAVVDNLTLKSNMTNKLIRLYLNATKVLSTDPCFHGYGYQTSNPTGCIPGSIHTWTDGSVYITDYTGTWHKLV